MQIKATIRSKTEPKVKVTKTTAKKTSKGKTAPARRPKEVSPVALAERRRSGRAHKVSDYKERADSDDEAEMLDGVAEWDYVVEDDVGDGGDDNASGTEQDESEESSADEEGVARGQSARTGRKTAAAGPRKLAVKTSVLG